MDAQQTIRLPGSGIAPADDSTASGRAGDLTEAMINADQWSDETLAAAGIPVIDTSIVSVGGGMGSFVFVDHLRIAGVPATAIKVLGVNDHPWDTYEYLTKNSQIPRKERLRSDSASTPDNIWGFPSYAMREAWHAKGIIKKLDPIWNVLSEPILTDYFTPRAGQVFSAIEREAERISYFDSTVKGLVRMTRKRIGGGYFTILTPPAGTTATKRVAYRSRYVHAAVGYPGLRFLPDLQEYRSKYVSTRVVNAYEPHEHVYEEINRQRGTVIVRGGGIVASRILQRLIDDRDATNNNVAIVHLFRTYYTGAHGPGIRMRRPGGDGWAFQGFNWPKAAWGGQLRVQLEKSTDEERRQLFDVMGGTTTPHRKLWLRQLARGRREGWYRTRIGEVEQVFPRDGAVITRIKTDGEIVELPASFIIDATGLEADISEHRYLRDLLEHSGAGRNIKNRLDVDPGFELRNTSSGNGRIYAVGSPTLGGYYAGVDSFLGLQYAALRIVDQLAAQGFCKRIGPIRSISQWVAWRRGKKI